MEILVQTYVCMIHDHPFVCMRVQYLRKYMYVRIYYVYLRRYVQNELRAARLSRLGK